MTEAPSEDDIRRMARARVDFRSHAMAYLLVNLLLAGIWWMGEREGGYWPGWVHLFWGLGLAFNAWHVYGARPDAVAREEEKLRAKYGRGP